MDRFARVVAAGIPHHVTQRGNARQYILNSDADRLVYLQFLQRACRLHALAVLGYCLMSTHVHLVVVPARPDSLAPALKYTHGRYAAYFNASHASSGHVWQGRYYSCPLDLPHLWAALRYAEMNPVRAGVVSHPARVSVAQCGHPLRMPEQDGFDLTCWREAWRSTTWREYLGVTPSARRRGDPAQHTWAVRSAHRTSSAASNDLEAPPRTPDRRARASGRKAIGRSNLTSRPSQRGCSGNVPSVSFPGFA